jgi:hypothetical protein
VRCAIGDSGGEAAAGRQRRRRQDDGNGQLIIVRRAGFWLGNRRHIKPCKIMTFDPHRSAHV